MREVDQALLMAAGVVLVGCSAPARRELPTVVWEGEHIRFAADDESPTCGGTAPYLDRLLGALGDRYGAIPTGIPTYYLLDGELSEFDTPCEEGAYACGDRDAVYAPIAPLDHEVVHLARWGIGSSYPLIEEGAAEYWGDDADIRGPLQGDLLDLASEGNELQFANYPRAGHFVAYLVDTYGEDTFWELSRRTTYESSLAAFRSSLVDVYGEDLEALAEDYASEYPECEQNAYRAGFGECVFTGVAPTCDSDGTLVLERQLDCADEDVLGPRFGRLWITMPVVLTTGSLAFIFRATPAADVELRIRRCGGGCPPSQLGPVMPSEALQIYTLDPGPHVLEVQWPEGQPLDLDLELRGMECP